MDNKHYLVITIINKGCSKQVMDAARGAGATGGTVLTGQGTGSQLQQFIGINLGDEKEIVMIVSEIAKTAAIIKAIKEQAGAMSAAQGITFSLPVGDFEMLSEMLKEETDKN